jgi:acetolactate synthase-1/2/3 large subunit
LIEWKMDIEVGSHSNITFTNPDFVQYAASFGATGYQIGSADELLPTLERALADDGVSIIGCPVDYSENLRLTARLGAVDGSI